jgi:hypothetical protein
MMRAMKIRLFLVSSVFALACGGADSTSPVEPAAPPVPATEEPPLAETPATEPAVAAPAFVLPVGKITLAHKGEVMATVDLAADGTFTATHVAAKKKSKKAKADKPVTKTGKLTADGTLEGDGKVRAKIGADGSVSVLHESVEKVDGKVVKETAEWNTIGVLGADGVFTGSKEGKKYNVGDDGLVVGFPDDMKITVEVAEPAQRRAALFLVLSFFAGGKSTMEMSGSKHGTVEAVPPIKDK